MHGAAVEVVLDDVSPRDGAGGHVTRDEVMRGIELASRAHMPRGVQDAELSDEHPVGQDHIVDQRLLGMRHCRRCIHFGGGRLRRTPPQKQGAKYHRRETPRARYKSHSSDPLSGCDSFASRTVSGLLRVLVARAVLEQLNIVLAQRGRRVCLSFGFTRRGTGRPALSCQSIDPRSGRGRVRRRGSTDVLQLSKSGKRAIGRVGRAPSHAATSNKLLMN